jgi:hypothetical protein
MNSFSGKSDRRLEANEEKPVKTGNMDDRTFSEVLKGAPKRIRSQSREAKAAKDEVDASFPSLLSANQTASSPKFNKQKKRDAKAAPAAEAAANEQPASGSSKSITRKAQGGKTRAEEKPKEARSQASTLFANGEQNQQASAAADQQTPAINQESGSGENEQPTFSGEDEASNEEGETTAESEVGENVDDNAKMEILAARLKRDAIKKIRAHKAKAKARASRPLPKARGGHNSSPEKATEKLEDASITSSKRSRKEASGDSMQADGNGTAANNRIIGTPGADTAPISGSIMQARQVREEKQDGRDGGTATTGLEGGVSGKDRQQESNPPQQQSHHSGNSGDGTLFSTQQAHAPGSRDNGTATARGSSTSSDGLKTKYEAAKKENEAVHVQQLPMHLPALAAQFVKCVKGGWCRNHCRNPPVGSLLNAESRSKHEGQSGRLNDHDERNSDSEPAHETPGHLRAEELRATSLSSIPQVYSPGDQSAMGQRFQLPTPDGWHQPPTTSHRPQPSATIQLGAKDERDGGVANSDGYETDDSGSRTSKLARREKLRQKIIERTGCDYGGAVLALATADTQRRDSYSLIYRGDAWRLSRACELITTKQAELKAEQKERWKQEVKLATRCTLPMAYLAVEAAEREPTLVRNGKLQVQELVQWAVRWVEERKAKRRTVEQEYEAGYVEHIQRVKAATEREQRNATNQRQAHEAGTKGKESAEATGEGRHQAKLCLTREAVYILQQMAEPMSEMLPPLILEDGAVAELAAELMATAHTKFGGDDVTPLEIKLALCALEAGRYLPEQHGWPSVAAAIRCLQKIQRQELWLWECDEVSRLTGVDLVDARGLLKRAQAERPNAPDLITVAVQLWGSQQRQAKGATANKERTEGNSGPSHDNKQCTRRNDEEDGDERTTQCDLLGGTRRAGGGHATDVDNSNRALEPNTGRTEGEGASKGGGCNDSKTRNRESDDNEEEDARTERRDLSGGVKRAGRSNDDGSNSKANNKPESDSGGTKGRTANQREADENARDLGAKQRRSPPEATLRKGVNATEGEAKKQQDKGGKVGQEHESGEVKEEDRKAQTNAGNRNARQSQDKMPALDLLGGLPGCNHAAKGARGEKQSNVNNNKYRTKTRMAASECGRRHHCKETPGEHCSKHQRRRRKHRQTKRRSGERTA